MVSLMLENLNNKNVLLLIFAGMMEITWLFAITCILFLILEIPLFPIITAIFAYFTPIIITFTLRGRGKRIFEYVIIHIFFYLLILLYTFYFYGNWTGSFLSFKWLGLILNKEYGSVSGYVYLIIIFWFSIYWRYGYKAAHRSNDYLQITSGFDMGIVVLVITFIILGATNMSLPYSSLLIIYYFLFSMFAIAIAKNISSSKTKHSGKISRISLILTFILVVLLFGSWIVLFFLPQMTSAAQTGYEVLKMAARPLGILLLKIITFIFGKKAPSVNTDPAYGTGPEMAVIEETEPGRLSQLLRLILSWGAIIVFSIIAIIIIGLLIRSLWNWFSVRTELDKEKRGFFEEILLWLKYLFSLAKKILSRLSIIIKKTISKEHNIFILFNKLCNWGQNSGIPKVNSKTPREYAKNISYFFPNNQQDIDLIVELFNQEIFGNKTINKEQLEKAKKAWARISSPSNWLLRIKVKICYARKIRTQTATS